MFITNAYAQSATDSAMGAFGGSGMEMNGHPGVKRFHARKEGQFAVHDTDGPEGSGGR